MVNPSSNIQTFLSTHRLSSQYAQQIDDWFTGIVEDLILHQKRAKRPIIIGINGAQGSGKSTLAECLVHLLTHQYHQMALTLSLDDFYLTHQQRLDLAATVHPLLVTRGVPGTHDIDLALTTIDKLLSERKNIAIPRFDKEHDDRFPVEEWPVLRDAPGLLSSRAGVWERALNQRKCCRRRLIRWKSMMTVILAGETLLIRS